MSSSLYTITVLFELVGISSRQNTVAVDGGIDNLDNDVLVGETYNETVLWCVVLVLVLNGQRAASSVIGLSFTAPDS